MEHIVRPIGVTAEENFESGLQEWYKKNWYVFAVFSFCFVLCLYLCIVFGFYMTDPIFLTISRILYDLSSTWSIMLVDHFIILLDVSHALFLSRRSVCTMYDCPTKIESNPTRRWQCRDFCTNVSSKQMEDQQDENDISIPRIVWPLWFSFHSRLSCVDEECTHRVLVLRHAMTLPISTVAVYRCTWKWWFRLESYLLCVPNECLYRRASLLNLYWWRIVVLRRWLDDWSFTC